MFTRNFVLILISNILLGAPMPMLIILGGLAGAHLSPIAYAATLAPSVQMLAGVLIAVPISIFMGRYGRKSGFLVGAAFIVIGGLMGMAAMLGGSFILLCIAHFLLGCALTCINFFRFAAAETVVENLKSKAISYTLASGLVAAFIGPEVFSYSKDYLAPIPFAGAYLAVAVLGAIGVLPVLALKGLASVTVTSTEADTRATKAELFKRPVVILAISSAALSQGVMMLIMTPTALAMVGCGFLPDQAADVIKWHVIAMFAPGFFTGGLIQRFGTSKITMLGMLILAGAAIAAIAGVALTNFYASLVLLGIGWNFGFIGSTHMLQSALSSAERPLVQGVNDTALAIAASAASLLSGAVYVGIGWTAISVAVLPILALSVVLGVMASKRFKVTAH